MSRYCINCKHFSPKEGDTEHEFARCSYNHPPSPVTGTLMRSSMVYCAAARMSAGACKLEGIYYEEKETTNV